MIAALFTTMLVAPLLHGDEPVPTANELNGRWIATDLVVEGNKVAVPKSPDSFWFDVDGEGWRYSFVVDGKRQVASFKVPLTKHDTGISIDAKMQNGVRWSNTCSAYK